MTAPEVPPPANPVPATTEEMSPVSDIASTPFVAVNPLPAIPDTKSVTLSFLEALESLASIIAILSFATSITAAVNSFKSISRVTLPDVPPPESPSPAVTPLISPAPISPVT